ncbi:hypothetical protein [Desulfobulbus oligotrophicus]|jgi:hypothetical protein|uniref:Uncharacterized protein n=1 Tax=Desulfobulbus oligotrophicus TaxID=1909699 RepID=A0A7T5VEX7_9BACT|nr:hypothetical protein [Desulfobulbus oligotrophicus]MDY0389810.1 hypothetical protein [Desulfobulbus oligotrophicus]QQG66551.1 hypothetical protein HP555_12070 [Desulfobulbus oligotrophicus]
MEQLITELKKILPFKPATGIGDIVLIVAKEPRLLVYAFVGDIVRDRTRRDEWWHVTLHLLSVPIQTLTWTLRTPQFTGQEIFTMEGKERFVQAVQIHSPEPQPSLESGDQIQDTARTRGLRIVK